MNKENRDLVLKSLLENKDALEKRNKEGIEKYRKGNFSIKFADGKSKDVKIKQITHKFLFGTTAFMLGSFEDEKKEIIYKETFAKLFNQAVVPFYWNSIEPEEGKYRFDKNSEPLYRRPPTDTALEFCRDYDLEPKGHCLVWNLALPDWFIKTPEEYRKEKVERRFKVISERYADVIPSFDIVNESATNYRRGKDLFFEDYDKYALILGDKYFHNNRKIINETNGAIWRDYVREGKYMAFNMQLKEMLSEKIPFDEIGLQYHIFCSSEEMCTKNYLEPYLDFAHIVEILDIYDKYEKPMHISEITIPGSGKNEINEEVQAILAKALYSTWFATRNMKSIVWWNMVDGYAAYAPLGTDEGENRCGGGLLRFDMSKKPSFTVLDELINKEWKTNIDNVVRGSEYTFRGFYGKYEITVDGKKYLVDLDKDNKEFCIPGD